MGRYCGIFLSHLVARRHGLARIPFVVRVGPYLQDFLDGFSNGFRPLSLRIFFHGRGGMEEKARRQIERRNP